MAMAEPMIEALADLNARLDGRAIGLWACEGEILRLVAFLPAADLPDSVRVGFVEATRAVPLSTLELSIVKARQEGEPVLAISETLPPELGSGYWLRAFGAACSLAVPVAGSDPGTTGVLSVATRTIPASPDAVAALLREAGTAMLDRLQYS